MVIMFLICMFLYEGQNLVMKEEPDSTLLSQLRELKALYRHRYEALRNMTAEVNYCQHLVDQCRVCLLSGQFSKDSVYAASLIEHKVFTS